MSLTDFNHVDRRRLTHSKRHVMGWYVGNHGHRGFCTQKCHILPQLLRLQPLGSQYNTHHFQFSAHIAKPLPIWFGHCHCVFTLVPAQYSCRKFIYV